MNPVIGSVRRMVLALCLAVTGGLHSTIAQDAGTAESANLEELEGDILIDGSSTVYLISVAAAEEFIKLAPDVDIAVRFSGTSSGFDMFCNSEIDIQDASRPISPDEARECADKGIDYIEIPVAMDGITVVVHPENDWVDCLTVDELRTMWEPAAEETITNWNQVRPGFPDAPLNLYGAGSRSGTYDYFTEAVVGEPDASRADYHASEDDRTLVEGVATDTGALGYFGYAYYAENQDRLRAVPVADPATGECHLPTNESILNGAYQPLSRPLFIYVRADRAQDPALHAFVEYYLSPDFTTHIPTVEIGYVPLSDALYGSVASRFDAGEYGTLFPDGQEIGASLDRYLSPSATPASTPAR
jgi:phosphate binding protein